MGNSYKVMVLNSLSESQKQDWVILFCKCFKRSVKFANDIFLKYELNLSRFSLVYIGKQLVAAYSGIQMQSNYLRVFMSTDTMSDGKVRGGSIIAGMALYEQLKLEGFDIVCGFPNKKIEWLRENKLGWQYVKRLNLYLIFKQGNKSSEHVGMIMNKPERGFLRSVPGILFLRTYLKPWYSILGLELSTSEPESFHINLSKIFNLGTKKFYVKNLHAQISFHQLCKFKAACFDSRSIDIP